MSTSKGGPIVDADGHVLEPLDTWQKYIDPKYRDRAVRLEHDEKGWEVLLFDNKPCETVRGTLGAIGRCWFRYRRTRSLPHPRRTDVCGWFPPRQL